MKQLPSTLDSIQSVCQKMYVVVLKRGISMLPGRTWCNLIGLKYMRASNPCDSSYAFMDSTYIQ